MKSIIKKAPGVFLFLISLVCGYSFGQDKNEIGSIYVSVDRGINWMPANNGLPSQALVNAWTIMDGNVFAGTESHGIFISADHMKSWYASSKGLPPKSRVISMTYAGNVLFVGTNHHGLYFSDNGGDSWQPANKGLTNLNVRALHYINNTLFAGTDNALFYSRDLGKTWNILLNGPQVNSIVSEKNELFVATNKGVVSTRDFGNSWEWIYKEGAIYTLALDGEDIYALDYFEKVYKGSRKNNVWIKAEMFLPFNYTFKLTPEGRQFFTSDWKRVINGINSTEDVFLGNGIPDNVYINEMLETPYGILAAGKTIK